MRSLLALLGLSLLLAACSNPFQPAPGTPDGEGGDGEGYGGTMSSSVSSAPAAMERVEMNASAGADAMMKHE